MTRWLMKPEFAAFILRITLAGIFIAHGWLKIAYNDWGTNWYPQTLEPIPAALQAAVAWGELLCGGALLLGFLTRWVALLLMAMQMGAIYMVTWKQDLVGEIRNSRRFGIVLNEVGYEYNYALIAMCACLVILGAGYLALDHFLANRKRAQFPVSAPMPEAPVAVK
jgi:putative oxidoreductase